jgi:hypothetical protein
MKKEDLIQKNIKAIKASIMTEEADDENFEKNNEILLKAAQKYMEDCEAKMLWAAKGKPYGYNGLAYGIAVSEVGNKAIKIKCHAYIDKEISEKGKLEICGIPVLKTPGGAETRSPLNALEDKLKGPIMAIPVFRDLDLHKRYINIDIGECHFTEAWSLSLTIIMAIINAIFERDEDPLTVYSANVVSDGRLEPVERIVRKLIAAKEQGAKRFILSSKNKGDVPKELLDIPDFEILFCDNLAQVMDHLHIPQARTTGKVKKDSTVKATKKMDIHNKNDSDGGDGMYTPKPIDTSHSKIPNYLEKLIELLSENVHDIWARQRMEEGWTFGLERNDIEKTNPDLIPYDELLPSEQEYDRNTVIGVIKAIIALGYRIEKK